jgi:hypothetical protein
MELEKYHNDYVVYLHKNPQTEVVFYVGMGNKKRPFCFRRRGLVWHNYVNKYGKPLVEIYKSNLSITEAIYLEGHLIKTFGRRRHEKYGVLINHKLCDVGISGLRHTDETRAKIGKAFAGKFGCNYGKRRTDESKLKMSIAKIGKKQDPDAIIRMRKTQDYNMDTISRLFPFVETKPILSHKDLSFYKYEYIEYPKFKGKFKNYHKRPYGWVDGRTKQVRQAVGRVESEETKKKKRDTHKKMQYSAKKVIDNNTGIVYNSLAEAGSSRGVSNKIISSWLTGKYPGKKNEFSYYDGTGA